VLTIITLVLELCGFSNSADNVKVQRIYKEIVGAFTYMAVDVIYSLRVVQQRAIYNLFGSYVEDKQYRNIEVHLE
jgi:hypothetical protein